MTLVPSPGPDPSMSVLERLTDNGVMMRELELMEKQKKWKEFSTVLRKYLGRIMDQDSLDVFEGIRHLLWDEGDESKQEKELPHGLESTMAQIINHVVKQEQEMLKRSLVVTIPMSTSSTASGPPVSGLSQFGSFNGTIQRKAKEIPSFDGIEPEPWNFARTLVNEWGRLKDVSQFKSLLPDMIVGNAAAWLTAVHGYSTLSDLIESFIETFVGLSKEELYASMFTVRQSDDDELAYSEKLILRADVINVALDLHGVQQLGEIQVLAAFKGGVEDQSTIPLAQTSIKVLRVELLRRKRKIKVKSREICQVEAGAGVTEGSKENFYQHDLQQVVAAVTAVAEEMKQQFGELEEKMKPKEEEERNNRRGWRNQEGSRKGGFNGHCHNCGLFGHSQRFCRKPRRPHTYEDPRLRPYQLHQELPPWSPSHSQYQSSRLSTPQPLMQRYPTSEPVQQPPDF